MKTGENSASVYLSVLLLGVKLPSRVLVQIKEIFVPKKKPTTVCVQRWWHALTPWSPSEPNRWPRSDEGKCATICPSKAGERLEGICKKNKMVQHVPENGKKRSDSTLKQNHHQSHHHAPHDGDVKPVLEHHSVHSAMGKAPASRYLKSDWCCSLQPSTWHALLWYFCSDALWAVPPSEKAVVHPAELIREKSGFDRPPFQSRHMSCLTAPACVSMRKE